jgi:two-component system, chemotaxis family, protein-glutamate methylesterase/glutaminase
MNRDIIAVGGSAGSLDTLRAIAAALPRAFIGNLFIAVHIGHGRSRLPELLAGASVLPVRFADDREPIVPGHIYVAPTDRHLVVEPGLLRLSHGPCEHFTRPAIDPLFRSIAIAYTTQVIGVVLSGGGSDGAAGLDAIKRAGGLALVIDPSDAEVAEMPKAATEIVHPDHVVSESEVPGLLLQLSRQAAPERVELQHLGAPSVEDLEPPLALTCPECGSTLRKSGSGSAAQYRCHIGHIFATGELRRVRKGALHA